MFAAVMEELAILVKLVAYQVAVAHLLLLAVEVFVVQAAVVVVEEVVVRELVVERFVVQ